MAKLTSIKTVLSAVTVYNLEIEQMSVKTAFIHGYLEDKIYTKQLERFFVKGNEDLVCQLKKILLWTEPIF